jgi:hypothetical protein
MGETIEQWEGYSVLNLTLKFFMFNASENSQIVAQEFSLCMWIYIYLMNVFKAHCTKAMSVYVATFG